MNDLQGRPHGALGVVFVRGGPAEIGQDAVAHVAGDKPVVARDHLAAEGAIRVQQAAQFFGVELFTQRRRTHQVAEHHGELAAFATVRHRIFAERSQTSRRSDGIGGQPLVQPGNSLEQPLAVTQREAELAKIRVAQGANDVEVDLIRGED